MAQSVILVTDVPGLGQIGEERKVKNGYARNYLLPRKLAVPSTPDTLRRFEKQKEKIEAERQKQLAASQGLAEKVTKVGLVFERPVGQGGRLFGSVTPLDIVSELSRQGITVEKKSVLMHGPLKAVGDQVIRVRLHSKVIVDVPVKVVGIEINKANESTVEEPLPTDFAVDDDN